MHENKYDTVVMHMLSEFLPVNPLGPFALFAFTFKNSFLVSFSPIKHSFTVIPTFSSILSSAISLYQNVHWFNSFDRIGEFGSE